MHLLLFEGFCPCKNTVPRHFFLGAPHEFPASSPIHAFFPEKIKVPFGNFRGVQQLTKPQLFSAKSHPLVPKIATSGLKRTVPYKALYLHFTPKVITVCVTLIFCGVTTLPLRYVLKHQWIEPPRLGKWLKSESSVSFLQERTHSYAWW